MKSIRIKTIILRYKPEIVKMIAFGGGLAVLMSLFYPGEETMKAMFDFIYDSALNSLFPAITGSLPGWVLWTGMIFGLLNLYIMAFAGVMIGNKIIPTVDDDGLDAVLANSSYSPRALYLWNYLGGICGLICVILPIYAILVIFAWVYDSLFILDELAYVFLIFLAIGIFFMTIASSTNIIAFSKKWGKTTGYGYLILAFIIDLLSGSPTYEKMADLSVSHYLQPTQVLFTGLSSSNFWDIWQPVVILLGITLIIGIIGLWGVKSPDFLERVKEIAPPAKNRSKTRAIGVLAPHSWMGKRAPVFTNHLRTGLKTFIILLLLVILQQWALYMAFPSTEEMISQIEQSNTPIYAAFAQNHTLPTDTLGFIILKFYDILWLYFGIVIAILAANIPTSDVHHSTHDLLLGNDISPVRLIFARIGSLVVGFSIYVWGVFLAVTGIQATSEVEVVPQNNFHVFLILWIQFLALGIFLVGVTLIPLVSKGKSLAMAVFIGFILLAIIPYLSPDFEFLKYFSFFNYYDPVGLILGEVNFTRSLIISSGFLIGSTGFAFLMVKFKFAKTDFR